jgi:hypothetical protein
MSVSLPVIVGAGAVIVALVCIGVCARRRRVRANVPATEPVEAVFVQDIPAELEPFVGAPEPQPAAAQVYPVHKLVQAVADGPITFGPTRQEAKPPAPVREPSLPEPLRELVVEPLKVVPFDQETEDAPAPLAPRLEVVPDPQPEVAPEPEVTVPEPQLQPVAPIMAREPVIDLPVEPQPEPAPVPEPAVAQAAPTAEVVMLSAQIEVLSETIARLTDRIEAVAAAGPVNSVAQPEPEPEPEPDVEPEFVPSFVSRTIEPELDEFALEASLEPEPITRPERSPQPPLTRRPPAEPTTYERRRVDDDLLAWPSDEELERYSGRQGRRDA